MSIRKCVMTSVALLIALAATPALAQEVVVSGPPPALRANMDAFVKAFNSTGTEAWEAMAKSVFTPEFLKSQTADQRAKAVAKLRTDFGTIAVQRVERQGGPDAPLQVFVKGSTASGVLWIDLDDNSHFMSLKGEVRKSDKTDDHRRD
jgi:hypothetical protein